MQCNQQPKNAGASHTLVCKLKLSIERIWMDFFVAISVAGCYDLNNGENKHKRNKVLLLRQLLHCSSKSDHWGGESGHYRTGANFWDKAAYGINLDGRNANNAWKMGVLPVKPPLPICVVLRVSWRAQSIGIYLLRSNKSYVYFPLSGYSELTCALHVLLWPHQIGL